MSAARPSAGGAAAEASPSVDVKAMPGILLRIVRLAMRYPGHVAAASLFSLLSAVSSLTLPRLFGHAVDVAQHLLRAGPVHAHDARAALWRSAVLVIVFTAGRGLAAMAAGYEAEWVSQKVAYDLRLKFFGQIQRLSFGFHDRIHSGDLITRGMLDMEGTRAFIQGGMMQTLTLVLLLGAASAIMILTDPVMAALGLAFVPVAGVALGRMGFLLRVTWLRVQQLMSILTLTMEENLAGIRVVRAFAGKAMEMAKFDKAANDALGYAFRRITLRYRAVSVMTASYYASMAALLWYGGHQVITHRMTVGRLTEFLTYMTLLQTPIRQIAIIFASAARATTSGGRLFEVLDLKPDIADAPSARPLAAVRGVLRFEQVGFAYDEGRPVLSGVDFTVHPGKTLGIIGPPGSGKSTLANLIPRFYDPTEGRISIDGQDIRNVTLASLRDYVGLVQQEAFLFDTTVTNNIAYADAWAEEARIHGAARTAQIHDYIAGLPARYDTRVGERGVALSGGQRQRMSIARGVLAGPGIVVFDDSTAAIDAVTERRVREALADATRSKATVIIAHRLSSLMHADEILVLDDGRVVERGDHASLLRLGGVYAELYELQSRTSAGGIEAVVAGEPA